MENGKKKEKLNYIFPKITKFGQVIFHLGDMILETLNWMGECLLILQENTDIYMCIYPYIH